MLSQLWGVHGPRKDSVFGARRGLLGVHTPAPPLVIKSGRQPSKAELWASSPSQVLRETQGRWKGSQGPLGIR